MMRASMLIAAAAGCALSAGQAGAHAFLRSATPAVGSTVPAAPGAVAITFTEGVEPAFSTIAVTDAAGLRVDSGDPHRSGPDTLVVGLKPLTAGRYRVSWHATSVDTHQTQGSYAFTVAP